MKVLASIVVLFALIGCGNKEEPTGSSTAANEPAVSPAAKAEADSVWTGRCAACHGADGDGAGPAGAALNPRPRNFHDQAWQGSADDARIEKVLREGGPSVGLSPLMPGNPDLANKPEVITALRQKIRSYRH